MLSDSIVSRYESASEEMSAVPRVESSEAGAADADAP